MARLVSFLLSIAVSLPLAAQAEAGTAAPQRVATITAGTGNALGWFGIQAERYLRDRYSVFGGVGYTPAIEDDYPSGATFAAGVRAFAGGYRHRAFLELSLSQLVLVRSFSDDDQRRIYGPGLQGGYQWVTGGGFTLMASLGVGYAPSVPEGDAEIGPLGGLSFGYTWRQALGLRHDAEATTPGKR